MPYALGAVKPHVKTAGEQLGARFGIHTIYGWAPGKYDHPKGLALDFMINNLSNGRQIGDALAAYVIANAASLGVTYVIWYRRIWSVARASEGWRPYSGDSEHTDHVHVSFSENPGSGMLLLDAGYGAGGYTTLSNPLDNFSKNLDKISETFLNSKMWIRVALFVLGCMLVGVAVVRMSGTAGYAMQAAKTLKGG